MGRRYIMCIAILACSRGDPGTTALPADESVISGVPNGSLHGQRPFPDDNWWNTDISASPVDANSATLISSCGLTGLHPDFGTVWAGAPNGIPYVLVRGTQKLVPVTFQYASESDPGPYPIPKNAPIEGGPNGTGDRHVLVLDVDHKLLYELFDAHPVNGGRVGPPGLAPSSTWRRTRYAPCTGHRPTPPDSPSFRAWCDMTRPSSSERSSTRSDSPARVPGARSSIRPVTTPALTSPPRCRRWECALGSGRTSTSRHFRPRFASFSRP